MCETTKTCFVCNELKPLSDYYKHKQMSDGRLGKCKECAIIESKKHRIQNIDKIRACDRARGSRQTKVDKLNYRKRNPKKILATNAMSNAVRNGKIEKNLSCSICGVTARIYGHHDDYDKPLSVRWMCQVCHLEWHSINGEGRNG